MAMKVKDAIVGGRRGLLRLFSSSSFVPKPPADPQQPEPNTNLSVSGLNRRTTTEGLKAAFSKFGEVVEAKVVTDDRTGFSTGFGVVKYATLDDAANGIEGMDGRFLDGWVIFAEYATPEHNACGSTSSSSTPS